jgi:hypothetical protein
MKSHPEHERQAAEEIEEEEKKPVSYSISISSRTTQLDK